MNKQSREYRRILREDFFSFLQRSFAELHGGKPLELAAYLQLMAATVDRVRTEGLRRLIICVPPRHLKSILASVAFPAWLLGHDPTRRIVCASYGYDLADKHARDCLRIMKSKWYRDLFGVRLTGQKATDFTVSQGGGRLATSVGGGVTGRGGDIVIIDDPHKPDEILSDTRRRATIEWYRNTLVSRINEKGTGTIIIIMQRLHEEDLVGHVLESGDWELLSLPAIADENECYPYNTIFGPEFFKREEGTLLNPDRENWDTIFEIWRSMGDYTFDGQYQQRPAPLSGGLVRREWFKTYRESELPIQHETIQSWDTANKDGDLNDYSVCTTWAVVDKKIYLKYVHRARHKYPDLKRAVRDQQQMHQATTVLIEDKGSGTQLAQELIHEGLYGVHRYTPKLDKKTRMISQTAVIENGFVYLLEGAPWLEAYLHELMIFPNGRHDDQVDSTSQFLEYIKMRQIYDPQPLFGSYGMRGFR